MFQSVADSAAHPNPQKVRDLFPSHSQNNRPIQIRTRVPSGSSRSNQNSAGWRRIGTRGWLQSPRAPKPGDPGSVLYW